MIGSFVACSSASSKRRASASSRPFSASTDCWNSASRRASSAARMRRRLRRARACPSLRLPVRDETTEVGVDDQQRAAAGTGDLDLALQLRHDVLMIQPRHDLGRPLVHPSRRDLQHPPVPWPRRPDEHGAHRQRHPEHRCRRRGAAGGGRRRPQERRTRRRAGRPARHGLGHGAHTSLADIALRQRRAQPPAHRPSRAVRLVLEDLRAPLLPARRHRRRRRHAALVQRAPRHRDSRTTSSGTTAERDHDTTAVSASRRSSWAISTSGCADRRPRC